MNRTRTFGQLHLSHGKFCSKVADPPRILITGALGQLGRGVGKLLKKNFGDENVIMSDVFKPDNKTRRELNSFLYVNVLDIENLHSVIVGQKVDWIVHFSALLSAVGENNVSEAIKVNIDGVHNVLEVARKHSLKIFVPSSIAAFGKSSPQIDTPNLTIQRPTTIYGVSKVHAELMGEYYQKKFGIDFRSLRLPGIISADTNPGGGTTDYAVKIFHDALQSGHHECYLQPHTRLPMMYVDDCLRAMFEFMVTPEEKLSRRTYNISAMSFTPAQLTNVIKKHVPHFSTTYKVCPLRQAIAESWPKSIDDSEARRDWGWQEMYNIENLTLKMFQMLNTMALKINCHSVERLK